MGRTIGGLAAAVALAFTAYPGSAHACGEPGPESLPDYVVEAGGSVTADGVLVLGVEGDVDPDAVELEVVRGGQPVAGSVEVVDLVGNGYSALWLFHPDEPLAVGSSYVLSVDGQDAGTIDVVEGDMSDLVVPVELWKLEPLLDRGVGRRACCHVDSTGPAWDCTGSGQVEETTEVCTGTQMQDKPWLQMTVDRDALEQRSATFASVYFEVFSGVDGAAETFEGRGQTRDLNALMSKVFQEQAGSYCFRLDVVNAADGSRTTDTLCEDDPGQELRSGPDESIDTSITGTCVDALYWEDTREPVTAEEVPHYSGLLEGDNGCSCTTGSPPGATVLLALGLLGLRRRR